MEQGENPGTIPPEMQEAIAEAHDHLLAKEAVMAKEAAPAPEQPVPKVSRKGRRGRIALIASALVVVLAGVAYLGVSSFQSLPLPEQEADLRWAVGQAVTRIEAFRMEKGRLPAEEDLFGLLSEAVVYSVRGDGYLVTGTTGPIRVDYDGSVPLDIWLEQAAGEGGSGPARSP